MNVTALLILLVVLTVYLAGFMATARILAAVDRKAGNTPDDDNMLMALMWPGAAPVLLAIFVVVRLYDFAVRDAGMSRSERRRRRAQRVQQDIDRMENELGLKP